MKPSILPDLPPHVNLKLWFPVLCFLLWGSGSIAYRLSFLSLLYRPQRCWCSMFLDHKSPMFTFFLSFPSRRFFRLHSIFILYYPPPPSTFTAPKCAYVILPCTYHRLPSKRLFTVSFVMVTFSQSVCTSPTQARKIKFRNGSPNFHPKNPSD